MDEGKNISFWNKNIVEKHKASFAFPSTSIYVRKINEVTLILFDNIVNLYIGIDNSCNLSWLVTLMF